MKQENIDKYAKITYKSDPIGEEGIVLYLTTFDIEKFEKDKTLERIPTKKMGTYIPIKKISMERPDYINLLSDEINKRVNEFYVGEMEKMKSYIECNRSLLKANWVKEE